MPANGSRGRPPKPIRAALSTQGLLRALAAAAALAIIGSVTVPGVARTRATAGRAGCADNLRRIGAAVRMYVDDNDDYYPIAYGNGASKWYASLAPWLHIQRGKDPSVDVAQYAPVLHCPLDSDGPAPVSYALNALLTGASSDNGHVPAESAASIVRPAEVVAAGDTNKNWSRTDGFYDVIADWIRPELDLGFPKTDERAAQFYHQWLKERDWTDLRASAYDCPDGIYLCKYPAFRHNRHGARTGSASVLFADGHVKEVAWGHLDVVNFFPYPTARQLALRTR